MVTDNDRQKGLAMHCNPCLLPRFLWLCTAFASFFSLLCLSLCLSLSLSLSLSLCLSLSLSVSLSVSLSLSLSVSCLRCSATAAKKLKVDCISEFGVHSLAYCFCSVLFLVAFSLSLSLSPLFLNPSLSQSCMSGFPEGLCYSASQNLTINLSLGKSDH